jgi:hypothetical protein
MTLARVAAAAVSALLIACCTASAAAGAGERAVQRAHLAPRHVLATQGPTDPAELYVLVTWDRSDPSATGYEVLRNGAVVARVRVTGDPWRDFAFKDTKVHPSAHYDYAVRARFAGGSPSALSAPVQVVVRSDGTVGSGEVFRVDSYEGSDLDRARAAVAAAGQAGGGVVLFGARTYTFDASLLVSADNVVLRGAGSAATFIQPSFRGAPEGCGRASNLIVFRGQRRSLDVRLAAPINIGVRSVSVASTAGLAVGQVIIFDQSNSERSPATLHAQGVVEDPGSGRDLRYPWDENEIVAISGRTVTFKYPFSQPFTTATRWQEVGSGFGDGIERLTLQGRSAEEQTYYQLLELDNVAHFTVAAVQGRWANRNYIQINGYDVRVVDFDGPYGGPRSYDVGSCKYKLTIFRAANVVVVGADMGLPRDDRNQSFVTIQKAQRILVRDSRFYGSRTYAIGEHGLGSRHLVFENNFISVGPNAKFAGILLGNNAWGFSGPVVVRNNSFLGNSRDLQLQENSYGVRFVDNLSRGSRLRVVDGYGWAAPGTPPALYGSLRLTVSGNKVVGAAGAGIVLGYPASPWYPYPGVRDVVIARNKLETRGPAIQLGGGPATTSRIQVFGNTGTKRYVKPSLVAGDYWAGNPDRLAFGAPSRAGWSKAFFAWETFDR